MTVGAVVHRVLRSDLRERLLVVVLRWKLGLRIVMKLLRVLLWRRRRWGRWEDLGASLRIPSIRAGSASEVHS